jgi:hypothetical protein
MPFEFFLSRVSSSWDTFLLWALFEQLLKTNTDMLQGLLVALVTTSCASALQSFVLRLPSVRTALGIKPLPEGSGKLPSLMQSYRFAIDKYKGKIAEARAEAERRQKFQTTHRPGRKL